MGWKEHFNNLLNKEQVVPGAIPHSLSSQTVYSGLEDLISGVDIESVIKHLSNHKAAGPDNIQASFIKNPHCINFFINKCLSSGSIPSAGLKSITQPIVKSGADPLNLSDYKRYLLAICCNEGILYSPP